MPIPQVFTVRRCSQHLQIRGFLNCPSLIFTGFPKLEVLKISVYAATLTHWITRAHARAEIKPLGLPEITGASMPETVITSTPTLLDYQRSMPEVGLLAVAAPAHGRNNHQHLHHVIIIASIILIIIKTVLLIFIFVCALLCMVNLLFVIFTLPSSLFRFARSAFRPTNQPKCARQNRACPRIELR